MRQGIAVIIPAFNEEKSIGYVIQDIPQDLDTRIIVVDNGSSDATEIKAREKGAIVVKEVNQGYGNACLAGIQYLSQNPPSIVVFLDADYSDVPSTMPRLVHPILAEDVDVVIGSRIRGKRDQGAPPLHVHFANSVFSRLINVLYHLDLSDLGPFRAIKWSALQQLQMTSKTYGWSSEMIVKAAKLHMKVVEVPVGCRKRMGQSKISGSVRGSLMAASYILYTIIRYVFWNRKKAS